MAELCGASVEDGQRCIRVAHGGFTHAWRGADGFVRLAPVPESAEEMMAVVDEVRRLVANVERERLRVERQARLEAPERTEQQKAYYERLRAEGVA